MFGDTSIYQGLRGKISRDAVPAAITDIGCEREINEDRYAIIDAPIGRMWAVCDGMGGTLGGELAAQLAIDAMRRSLLSAEMKQPCEALVAATEEANRVIVLRRQNPAFSGMGTTVAAVLISDGQVAVAHAGDSRAYVIRGQEIQQLTVDHTYVQDLVDRGAITEEEAMSHPQAHVLTKCLGASPRLDLDTQEYWIWPTAEGETEDRLFLCTDGLYSLVSDQEIADVVSRLAPQEACAELTELAKSRGGYDNITVTILPIGGQLREEAPDGARPVVRHVEERIQPTLSFGAKVTIALLVGLIGFVLAALWSLYKVSTF